jgi:hypothetical protein
MDRLTQRKYSSIAYFEAEGRQNLNHVLRMIKKVLKKREDLRHLKLVIFTAEGQGPAIAYSVLREFATKIVAVTFPPRFSVKPANSEERYFPRIPDELRGFFAGAKVEVIVPPTLPFDSVNGLEGHNQQVEIVKSTIAVFGSGFSLSIQAVLLACDLGHLEEGEQVIAMSGDTAGLFVASTTAHFLNKTNGLQIQEIFCKPRGFTISRRKPIFESQGPQKVLEGKINPTE